MNTSLEFLARHRYWIVGVLVAFLVVLVLRPENKTAIPPATEATFQADVANETRPVLVKFGATWCGPCKTMDKALETYATSSSGDVKIVRIDVDSNPDLARHYRVSSIPHTFLFKQGMVVADVVGGMDANEINTWVKNSVK
jgi:thioredoxin 1